MQANTEETISQEQSITDVKEYLSLGAKDLGKKLAKLEKEMHDFASDLNFEEAAKIRDKIKKIEENM